MGPDIRHSARGERESPFGRGSTKADAGLDGVGRGGVTGRRPSGRAGAKHLEKLGAEGAESGEGACGGACAEFYTPDSGRKRLAAPCRADDGPGTTGRAGVAGAVPWRALAQPDAERCRCGARSNWERHDPHRGPRSTVEGARGCEEPARLRASMPGSPVARGSHCRSTPCFLRRSSCVIVSGKPRGMRTRRPSRMAIS